MPLSSHATHKASDAADVLLGALADGAEGSVAVRRRVMTSADRLDPDEGLALLDAYVSIVDASVRQAVLDIVLAIAGTQTQDGNASQHKTPD